MILINIQCRDISNTLLFCNKLALFHFLKRKQTFQVCKLADGNQITEHCLFVLFNMMNLIL